MSLALLTDLYELNRVVMSPRGPPRPPGRHGSPPHRPAPAPVRSACSGRTLATAILAADSYRWAPIRAILQITSAPGSARTSCSLAARHSSRRPVSYTHLRAHETRHDLVCRLLL